MNEQTERYFDWQSSKVIRSVFWLIHSIKKNISMFYYKGQMKFKKKQFTFS